MKPILCVVVFLVLTQIIYAQTPAFNNPLGKMKPCPHRPFKDPDPYQPPPMQAIPAGEFEMGDHHDGNVGANPVHPVYIDAFQMDTFEVTNEEYRTFLSSALKREEIEVFYGVVYKKGDSEPYCDTDISTSSSRITWDGSAFGITPGKEDHPMVNVSWYGAVAYANWRSIQEYLPPCYDLETWECDFQAGGYRLPTEAEWEKAARGAEHNPYYRYPWGDMVDGSMANYLHSGHPYGSGDYPWTTPVGYYDGNQIPAGVDMANGYGLHDMAGNVFEWCNDWYDATYYQYCVDHAIYNNPVGPVPGIHHVFRGGCWFFSVPWLGCAVRKSDTPHNRFVTLGFRLVLG